MIKLRTLLNESLNKNIINTILDELEPTIEKMLSQIEKWVVEKTGTPFTKYDREMARLSLIADLVKAVETYTLPTDKLVSINASPSGKGSIQITAQIERDGTVYPFETDAILAGGHNIQSLHYRYITKTRLGKTNRSELTKVYQDKIKHLSKIDKINQEIKSYQTRIDAATKEVDANSKLTDQEIIDLETSKPNYFVWPSWEELKKRGADANYDYDEDLYNKEKSDSYNSIVPKWKNTNIIWKQKHIKDLQTAVDKLKKKLI